MSLPNTSVFQGVIPDCSSGKTWFSRPDCFYGRMRSLSGLDPSSKVIPGLTRNLCYGRHDRRLRVKRAMTSLALRHSKRNKDH